MGADTGGATVGVAVTDVLLAGVADEKLAGVVVRARPAMPEKAGANLAEWARSPASLFG